MSQLVTIASFMFAPQAAVPAALLESNGIFCFVKDELTTQTGIYSNAIGGVKVQVWEEDAQKAAALLLQGGFITESDLFPSKAETFLTRLLIRLRLISKN